MIQIYHEYVHYAALSTKPHILLQVAAAAPCGFRSEANLSHRQIGPPSHHPSSDHTGLHIVFLHNLHTPDLMPS